MRALYRASAVVGSLLIAGTMGVAPASASHELDLFTRLHHSSSFPNANGVAEYERGSTGRELEVTVNNINRLADRYVFVYVAGTKVGRIHVANSGWAHREWDTNHGDAIPRASKGDWVKIRTHSGTLVAKGSFGLDTDT